MTQITHSHMLVCAGVIVDKPCFNLAVKVKYVCVSLIYVGSEFQLSIALTENDNWPNVLNEKKHHFH